MKKKYWVYMDAVFHDNGEVSIGRDGCKGVEYYLFNDAIARLDELAGFGMYIRLACYFVKDDSHSGFYMANKSITKKLSALFDSIGVDSHYFGVANIETENGRTAVAEFYYHRDSGKVGWAPYSAEIALELKEKDKRLGINSFKYDGLYKQS